MIPERLPKPMPKPPRLHWGFVLLFQIVTFGLFNAVWLLVQANWVRRVNGTSKAFWWAIIYICMLPAMFLLLIIEGAVGVRSDDLAFKLIVNVFQLGIFVVAIGAVFILRSELELPPISVPLGGVMTFLFQSVYFQYHLHDYDVEGKAVPEGSLGLSSGD